MSSLNPGGEHRTVLMGDDEPVLKIKLPRGIGHVEICTGNVHGPTGYPVVSVEVHSDAEDRPASDGRLYSQVFTAHDDTITLLGRPGPKLAEQERLMEHAAMIVKAHDSGDHSTCPSTCPAAQAARGH